MNHIEEIAAEIRAKHGVRLTIAQIRTIFRAGFAQSEQGVEKALCLGRGFRRSYVLRAKAAEIMGVCAKVVETVIPAAYKGYRLIAFGNATRLQTVNYYSYHECAKYKRRRFEAENNRVSGKNTHSWAKEFGMYATINHGILLQNVKDATGKEFEKTVDIELTPDEIEAVKSHYAGQFVRPENVFTIKELAVKYVTSRGNDCHECIASVFGWRNINPVHWRVRGPGGGMVRGYHAKDVARVVSEGALIAKQQSTKIAKQQSTPIDSLWDSEEQHAAALARVDAMLAENRAARDAGLPPVHWRAGYKLKTRYAIA